MLETFKLRCQLDELESINLSPFATKSADAIREYPDVKAEKGHRQWFSLDTDRILHSLAYTRYIDKTQVFYLIPNDHLTHRVLHVQLVSKIARTIGRLLRLNEDLIEAIALGHDIGHPPFGHDGERFLSKLCKQHGIAPFLHSIQGVRFLRHLEKKGQGCNLSLQTLDGILCHDGEAHSRSIAPERNKSFKTLDEQINLKQQMPTAWIVPMTLEGCLVRMADVVSYIGRDIEDAIRLNLIDRQDIPRRCKDVLGDSNGTIVYRLVDDLVQNSYEQDRIAFSDEVADELLELKRFNYERIYLNPVIKSETGKVKRLYSMLFEHFLGDLKAGRENSVIFKEFLNGMASDYVSGVNHAEIVRDFMSGMTDAYFLRQGRGLLMPSDLPARFEKT